jgi:osomolarity two-component system sensor histidine kinase SLN1
MLKLEEIYDVVVAKDGQEAYDMVKESMGKGQFFDLIFMDIQVSVILNGCNLVN